MEKGYYCFSADQVILKAITDARVWQEAQQLLRKPASSPCVKVSRPLPLNEAFRCCVDAAWSPITGHSGAGWVIHDPSQNLLLQSTSTRLFVSSALAAEALGLKACLLSALNADIKRLNVFSDSQTLVKLMNSGGITNELKGILQDIRSLCNSFDSISFAFLSRLNNIAADALAKSALLSVSVAVTTSSNGG